MLCELIALASLIAHGDVRDQTKTLSKEFRADEIIKRLEKLHPDFYPYPVIVEVRNDTNEVILTDQTKPYLTKAELPKLYGRCGDFLHRGTARKLASLRAPETMLVIARWTNKIVALLNDHRISSIDNKRHLLVLMSAGGVGGQGGRV